VPSASWVTSTAWSHVASARADCVSKPDWLPQPRQRGLATLDEVVVPVKGRGVEVTSAALRSSSLVNRSRRSVNCSGSSSSTCQASTRSSTRCGCPCGSLRHGHAGGDQLVDRGQGQVGRPERSKQRSLQSSMFVFSHGFPFHDLFSSLFSWFVLVIGIRCLAGVGPASGADDASYGLPDIHSSMHQLRVIRRYPTVQPAGGGSRVNFSLGRGSRGRFVLLDERGIDVEQNLL